MLHTKKLMKKMRWRVSASVSPSETVRLSRRDRESQGERQGVSDGETDGNAPQIIIHHAKQLNLRRLLTDEVEDEFIFHLIFHSINPLWINELSPKKWKVEDKTPKKLFLCVTVTTENCRMQTITH